MKMKLFRQGDILFAQISKQEFDRKPRWIEPNRSGVVARGETTGHIHQLDGNGVLFGDREGLMWVVVEEETAEVRHNEHAPIELPQGFYRVIVQREFTEDGFRNVSD